MNAVEDLEDKDMDEGNPQCLSAAVCKRGFADMTSDSGDKEVFNFEYVNAMPDLDNEEEPAKGKVVSDINQCLRSNKLTKSTYIKKPKKEGT